jgi:hypothetical protein
MVWLAIAAVLLCLAVLWTGYNPDRHHTRPPTYRPARHRRGRKLPHEREPFRDL